MIGPEASGKTCLVNNFVVINLFSSFFVFRIIHSHTSMSQQLELILYANKEINEYLYIYIYIEN